jgi:hypothetical protein
MYQDYSISEIHGILRADPLRRTQMIEKAREYRPKDNRITDVTSKDRLPFFLPLSKCHP